MFTQFFGDSGEVSEADVISAIEFDETGEYLATGDRGGRVMVFRRNGDFPKASPDTTPKLAARERDEWCLAYQFQSHEQEFDYLKSLEIEERINQICWMPTTGQNKHLLTTNEKTVKLWKVGNRPKLQSKPRPTSVKEGGLSLPTLQGKTCDRNYYSSLKSTYANAHAYHINAISLNSDGETFLSADDLRINWWNTEVTDTCFNIVDMKPPNMEELTEVITAARFHPTHCHYLMYSTSRGIIKLGDTRAAALCDRSAKTFEEPEDFSSKSFFSEIVASISDISFAMDGRYIYSRDYMTLKVWDIAMENKPVKVININEKLRPMLCELYESDCIFDKFEIAASNSGDKMLTGSYGNQFSVWNRSGEREMCCPLGEECSPLSSSSKGRSSAAANQSLTTADLDKKVLHCAWNPQSNVIAIAAQANLYVYNI